MHGMAGEPEPPDYDFAAPHPNGAVHPSGITRARRIRRRVFLVGGILLVAVWIFAIVWSVTVTSHSPERLDANAASAVAAACNDTQAKLRALPNPSPVLGADRVARIRAEDAQLRAMLRRFDAVTPRSKTPTEALRGWTADWGRVVDARERYAADLEAAKSDPSKKVKFVLPAVQGVKPVTDKMDDFVRENHPDLDACFTEALQVERVEGARTYGKVTQ